jgi:hypothetical protein
MEKTTCKAARVKAPEPQRYARYWMPRDAARGILRIVKGAKVDLYWVGEIDCDFGRGFAVEKWAGVEVYHVHLDATGDSCDCLGHIRWGHKTVCKHVAGIKACIQAGRI